MVVVSAWNVRGIKGIRIANSIDAFASVISLAAGGIASATAGFGAY